MIFFGYNLPAAIARELFKPSTDAASLLGCIKKKLLIWVRGLPGRGSQSGGVFVFLTNFDGPWTPIQWAKKFGSCLEPKLWPINPILPPKSAFSDFGGKMVFLGHNFGSKHAGRSSKGSIDAGDHLVYKKHLSQNSGPLDWHPGPIKVGQKTKNTPTLRASPRWTTHPNQKFFFNRTKKTCRIRRGFEQLS